MEYPDGAERLRHWRAPGGHGPRWMTASWRRRLPGVPDAFVDEAGRLGVETADREVAGDENVESRCWSNWRWHAAERGHYLGLMPPTARGCFTPAIYHAVGRRTTPPGCNHACARRRVPDGCIISTGSRLELSVVPSDQASTMEQAPGRKGPEC